MSKKCTSIERKEEGDNTIKIKPQHLWEVKLQREQVAKHNLKETLPDAKCSRKTDEDTGSMTSFSEKALRCSGKGIKERLAYSINIPRFGEISEGCVCRP